MTILICKCKTVVSRKEVNNPWVHEIRRISRFIIYNSCAHIVKLKIHQKTYFEYIPYKILAKIEYNDKVNKLHALFWSYERLFIVLNKKIWFNCLHVCKKLHVCKWLNCMP